MIEREHQLIVDALVKLFKKIEKLWSRYLHVVFWVNRITIRKSTKLSSFRFKYEYDVVLLIKMKLSI